MLKVGLDSEDAQAAFPDKESTQRFDLLAGVVSLVRLVGSGPVGRREEGEMPLAVSSVYITRPQPAEEEIR